MVRPLKKPPFYVCLPLRKAANKKNIFSGFNLDPESPELSGHFELLKQWTKITRKKNVEKLIMVINVHKYLI